jgi:hypothetical protein
MSIKMSCHIFLRNESVRKISQNSRLTLTDLSLCSSSPVTDAEFFKDQTSFFSNKIGLIVRQRMRFRGEYVDFQILTEK